MSRNFIYIVMGAWDFCLFSWKQSWYCYVRDACVCKWKGTLTDLTIIDLCVCVWMCLLILFWKLKLWRNKTMMVFFTSEYALQVVHTNKRLHGVFCTSLANKLWNNFQDVEIRWIRYRCFRNHLCLGHLFHGSQFAYFWDEKYYLCWLILPWFWNRSHWNAIWRWFILFRN